VNTTSGSLGDLVSERQIAELPINGRNYINLTLMQPGVQENRGGRGSTGAPGTWISVNGAPIRSNNFLLDGAPIVSDTGGTTGGATGATLGIEGIREWKIVTNQYDAQYGMRMGSQLTMVTKGGTNDFHGTLFEYHRNSALDARNFFDLQSDASTRRLPAFTRNQFGGAFGGPILRDKLFFFATYEGLRERKGLSIISQTIPAECQALTNNPCIPNSERTRQVNGRQNLAGNINPVIAPIVALYPLPNLPGNRFTYPAGEQGTEDYGQIRGDWNMGANDMFFARYTNSPSNSLDPLDFPPFIGTREFQKHILSASDSHIFSPSLLGTFRYSVTFLDQTGESPMPEALNALSLVRDGKAPAGRGLPRISPGDGVTVLGPRNNTPAPRTYTTHTWSGDMFYTRGNHSFKFGTLINRLFQQNTHGNQYFGQITGGGLGRFLNGDPQTLQVQGADINNTRQYRWWTYGFYLQDDFRAMSNLTLNLGLRYEFHTTYRAPDGIESSLRDIVNDTQFTVGPLFQNPSLGNVSPRFGFAW
ncbi:MAG: TonB-dependent receptor domain-containing protein, partial [Terriglobia bacterium]